MTETNQTSAKFINDARDMFQCMNSVNGVYKILRESLDRLEAAVLKAKPSLELETEQERP